MWITSLKVFPSYHLVFLSISLLTGFAAVYLCHHYVIDVLLGALYAVIVHFAVGWLCNKVEERDRSLEWWRAK